jgi:hypothetical protein
VASVAPSPVPTTAPASVEPSEEPEPTPEPTPVPTPVPSDLAACGDGQAALLDHRSEVPADLHFGGATLEFTTAGIRLRNGSYGADDAIPGGLGLDRDEIAVRVDPGTHIVLRGTGLTLRDLTAGSHSWAAVDFSAGLAAFPDDPVGLDWRLRADGSISVSAPLAPGDYAVELFPRWQSACLEGDGTAYGRIKVNG